MTYTETTSFEIPRETIETSMRRARRLRSRVVFRLMRRMARRLSTVRLRTAPTPIRPAIRPA